MNDSIVPLAAASDVSRYGGKAANLARLMRSGAPVPDGVVILNGAVERGGVDAADVWSRLGFPIAIVRSSAVGEDSPDASFAGQLDSIPGVTTPDALRDAIARVWASQRSARVLAYQAARGITLAGMGVIMATGDGLANAQRPTSKA